MRILFLSHYAWPHIGGIETVVDGLGRELRERGHDIVHVAAVGGQRDGVSGHEATGVIRVASANFLEERLEVPYPLFHPRVLNTVRREVRRADVVHAHGFLYLSCVAGLLYARARETHGPVRVLTEHVGSVSYGRASLDLLEHVLIGSLGRACVRAAQAVVILNERVRAELESWTGDRLLLKIHNGVDTRAYRPPGTGEREALRRRFGWDDTPRVLFVGRLVPRKRLEIAVESTTAAGGKFKLVVVGPGRYQSRSPHVDIAGPRPHSEVALMYRAADALLQPSEGEGFPMTVQEGMASGLPAVLTDDALYHERLRESGHGAWLAASSPGDIAATVEQAIAAGEQARRAAADHARRAFSVARAAAEYEDLYLRLQRAKPAPLPRRAHWATSGLSWPNRAAKDRKLRPSGICGARPRNR